MVCPYANTSIILGFVLVGGSVLSLPVPQLRVVFKNFVVTGGAGAALIALGVLLGSFGICGTA